MPGSPLEQAPGNAGDSGNAAAGNADNADHADNKPAYDPGVLLVGLSDGMTAADLTERLASLDFISTKSVAESDVVFGYVELELAGDVTVEEAEALIAEEIPVASAQPNYTYRLADGAASASPSDAAVESGPTGGLAAGTVAQRSEIDDVYRSRQWGLEAVRAYDAWDIAKGEGAVTVAVVDTGLDVDHEDFASDRIVAPYSTVNDDTSDVRDGHGHGTHVAGIVAATANNATGVAGVSYNANIMPVQVLDSEGYGDTIEIARGLQYICDRAAAYGVRVVNMSMGGDEYDECLMEAVKELHTAGLLVVYSGGNDAEKHRGAYTNFPSDYDMDAGAIGVISCAKKTGDGYERSDFSNYNQDGQSTEELSAPGSAIYSTVVGGYGYKSGTSMAAPHVSGIAALMFAANPGLTPAKARNILCDTAQDMNESANLSPSSTFDYETGYGLVDAAAAVEAAASTPAATTSLSGAKAALSKSSYVYNGAACTPQASVSLNGVPLVKGVDYSVAYSRNVNAGTAKVTITGEGDYAGSIEKTFTIQKAPIASVSLSKSSYVYNGAAKSPVLTARGPKSGKAGQKLTSGTDYTLKVPSGRKKAGQYVYSVTGKGNYTGVKTATLSIAKAANTMKASIATKKVSAKSLKVKAQSVKPITLKAARGTVSFAKKSGSKYLAIGKATGKVTVKKGTPKGKRTMKVLVKAAGNANYKAASKTVNVTVVVA